MTVATSATYRLAAASSTTLFAAVLCGALLLALGLRLGDFIHHDTAEVVMWGHSGWALGFWKHPPFLPWIARLWFGVWPMSPLFLALLTALNMTVCAWAVWRIAALDSDGQDRRVGILAILLLASVPYATGMAVKLNHNSALISMWPLTTLAFLRALDRPTLWRGVLFGLAAAAAMLTKYYSGLLLLACVAASFAQPARALAFYRAPAPYAAVAAFAVAMLPHALWMREHRASSLSYAFSATVQGIEDAKHGAAMALSFAIQTPLILAPLALAGWLIWYFDRRSLAGGRPHRFERQIVILALIPYLLTVTLTAFLNLRGAIAWAMPVFVCLPAVLAVRLGQPSAINLKFACRTAAVLLICIAIGGQIALRMALTRGADGIAEPRRAIAEDITQAWRSSIGTALPLVAGDQRLASAAVIFSADHPQAWPSFNPIHAPWVDPATARKSGFVALCRAADAKCLATAAQVAGPTATRCPLKRRVSVLGSTGPWFEAVALMVPPAASPAKPTCPTD